MAATYIATAPNGTRYACSTLREARLVESGRTQRSRPRRRRSPVHNPYIDKIQFPSGNWGYIYSPEDVAKRHAQKAKKIAGLKARYKSLEQFVRRDVKAGNPVALAVALIMETYERPGNSESAKDGHFGVTGWQCRHLRWQGGKAIVAYVAKSGVEQAKTISDPLLVAALRAQAKGCRPGSKLVPTTAATVNRYLKAFSISAKDLRTYGANTEMQHALASARRSGPDLAALKERDRAKALKAEFQAALTRVAGKLGHTTAVLKKQYLVAGIEPLYLSTGNVLKEFA